MALDDLFRLIVGVSYGYKLGLDLSFFVNGDLDEE